MNTSDGPRGRFAPSTTGPAHAGTLLAALLCWLDMRSRGGRVLLRLEDIDPQRCRPTWASAMAEDLTWLGLDWDGVVSQSAQTPQHHAALDRLAARGVLYACNCSRTVIRQAGRRAPDGGWAYPNTCRQNLLTPEQWRASPLPLRVALPDEAIHPHEASSLDLHQRPALDMGDPLVRRRDGAVAYQLAVVVDDAAWGITDVVRGRDIAPSTATQVCLQRLLDLPEPRYRHHLLLCEPRGAKLAKLHGSVGAPQLRAAYSAAQLCGFLAWCSGLQTSAAPCSPQQLLQDFSWDRVLAADQTVAWDGQQLHWRRV